MGLLRCPACSEFLSPPSLAVTEQPGTHPDDPDGLAPALVTLIPVAEVRDFSDAQKVQFREVSYWMGITGRVGRLLGIFAIAMGFFDLILLMSTIWFGVKAGDATVLPFRIGFDLWLILGGIFAILVGIWTIRAGRGLGRVGKGKGQDAENLLSAIANLTSLYKFQAIVIGIVSALIAFTIVWLLVDFSPPR